MLPTDNPSKLDDDQRTELGITRRLPKDLNTALQALEQDSSLKEAFAEDVVSNYLVMKRAEQSMLDKVSDEERKIWLIERY
jgi:glutamine synthetase